MVRLCKNEANRRGCAAQQKLPVFSTFQFQFSIQPIPRLVCVSATNAFCVVFIPVHLSKVNISKLVFHVLLPTNIPHHHPCHPIFPSKLSPFQSLRGAKQQKFSVHVVFRYVCFFQQQNKTEKSLRNKNNTIDISKAQKSFKLST